MLNEHQEKLLHLLKSESKVVVMLAPSFVIDFPHPQMIGMLRKIGFEKVVELTFGARMVNYWYREYIISHPNQKVFITSPCPTTVFLIQKQYPTLVQYLMPYASPMYAMAKIIRKEYPEHKIAFISPCQAKRVLEAPRYPDFIDTVVTFKEMKDLFENEGIKAEDFTGIDYPFDSFITEGTKIYPMSGGLAKTAHVQEFFKPEEICITDGAMNNKKILDDLKSGTSPYRFVDILNCTGGCIGGPDFANKELSHEQKDQLIIDYRTKSMVNRPSGVEGKKEFALDIDFGVKF